MTVLLANPNTSSETTAVMYGIVRAILPDVRGWTAAEGPPMITNACELTSAASLVAQMVIPHGTSGIIGAAFGDPGWAALAERLDIPVIGIGAAAARAARARGPFAVATTMPKLKDAIDALMRAEAGAGSYLGCWIADGNPLELMQDANALDAALLRTIMQAAKDGARTVIIGGGPLGAAAERLVLHTRIPLINPLVAAAREMQQVLRG